MPAREGSQQAERLQKVLAHAGVDSRRKCEELILAGRVSVNGEVVTQLGIKVRPGVDRLEVDGKTVTLPETKRYYLLYKPVGYLSTVSDPHGRSALELVHGHDRLYPVGRLDLESEGLLLVTDDGELAQRLMHPRYEHAKEYMVLIHGRISEQEIGRLRKGVRLDEGDRLAHAEVTLAPRNWTWRRERLPRGTHWVRVVLREGRKHQIRHMLLLVGCRVRRLIRVRMANLVLGELQPGQGRWLEDREAQALRRFVRLKALPQRSKEEG